MGKQEFLGQLQFALQSLPPEEVKEIIYDYAEHIDIAVEKGESAEDVIKRLGPIKVIAKEYTINRLITQAQTKPSGINYGRVFWATLGLGFFNLVFVLGPFIGLWGVIFGFFMSGVALLLSGIAVVFASLLMPFGILAAISNSIWETVAVFGIGLTLGSIGGLLVIGMGLSAKWFYQITLNYLKLNQKVMLGKEGKARI